MKSNKFKNSTLQYSLCEFCGSKNFLFICSRDDESQVANCLNCDLVSVNPLPDQNHLNSINKAASQNIQSKAFGAYLKISQNKHKELDPQEKNDMKIMQLIETPKRREVCELLMDTKGKTLSKVLNARGVGFIGIFL